MRTLAILGFAAVVAFQSAPAAPPLTAQGGGRWEGVPNLALRPPGSMMTRPITPSAPGQWNGGPHWQGRTGWAGPGRTGWQPGGGGWGHGFGGHHFRPRTGIFLPPVLISPRFHVRDWRSYGLAEPGFGQYWMRYDDDVLLLDGRGYVYDMAPAVDWQDDGGDERYDGFDDEAWYQDDAVTCCGDYRMSYAPVVHYVPAGTTTVIIQNPVVVTRTSYVEEEVVRAAPRKGWKAKRSWKPRKVWKPRPQCRC